jgi:eukaryotic-like serine/threonine-protein kinase
MTMDDISPQPTAPAQRWGHFDLIRQLSRTEQVFTWLALDHRSKTEVVLCQPRKPVMRQQIYDNWLQDISKITRLRHPCMGEMLDAGHHEGQPYASYEYAGFVSLVDRLTTNQSDASVIDIATWAVDILDALAYAHESGIAHRDLSLASVLIDTAGHAKLIGLGVAVDDTNAADQSGSAILQKHRADSEVDLLMSGLLMYRLLAGVPALDEADLYKAALRVGLEIVRLPWTTPKPVPETLRAIVNRATDRQKRQRYLNARTLLSALQAWLKVNGKGSVDPLALFLDRIDAVGLLPSRENAVQGSAHLLKEELRVDDIVDIMVQDPAMCWELLRTVNMAKYRSSSTENGVASMSRAIVLIGQQGLRQVAGVLRAWPGALESVKTLKGQAEQQRSIEALRRQMNLTYAAGMVARWLRPFNIGDDEAMLAAMSQRLGQLLILYHYPDESGQIETLMKPVPSADPTAKPTPGMSRAVATGAVMGIDPSDLTTALLKHWGYPEALVQAACPLSTNVSPKRPESPEDWLSTIASLSNELVNIEEAQPANKSRAWSDVVSRYARATLTTQAEMEAALYRALKAADAALSKKVFPDGPPQHQRATAHAAH